MRPVADARRGRRLAWAGVVAALAVAGGAGVVPGRETSGAAILWHLDTLERIGGHAVEVLGAPRVVETPLGRAVEFDGRGDGLVVGANPLEGLARFTLEVVFEPAADGGEEQRFVHMEEAGTANRALVELRLLPERRWTLDTYLRHGEAGRTLIDRAISHPVGQWHAAALTFDGTRMAHYVDGVREGDGDVAFRPLGPGRASIGVRLNRVSWFKGRIRTIRVTPDVLAPGRMLTAVAR